MGVGYTKVPAIAYVSEPRPLIRPEIFVGTIYCENIVCRKIIALEEQAKALGEQVKALQEQIDAMRTITDTAPSILEDVEVVAKSDQNLYMRTKKALATSY